MKKLLFLAAFLSCTLTLVVAQQRVTLVEHFTGANCGPCANTNPVVDPIYTSHFPNVVVIKYQFPAPSGDIMYYENTQDVAVRGDYYGINSAPSGVIDGNYKKSSANTPVTSIMTNANLSAAYGRETTWDINLDYEIIEGSEIKVTMDITSLTEQSGDFVAHIVLVEEEINFATAPGSNGEKSFKHVMRKMLPSAEGTSLKTSWEENEEHTITEQISLPYYYRSLEELAVVAFIQKTNDKSVQQAAYAAPKTFDDVADVEITDIKPLSNENVIPVVTVKSTEIETLTSAVFKLFYPDNKVDTYKWTGEVNISGNGGEIELTGLPINNIYEGANKYRVSIWFPNEEVDVTPFENNIQSNWIVKFYQPKEISLPLFEDFEFVSGGYIYSATLENAILLDWEDTGDVGIYQSGASWKLGANNSAAAVLFRNVSNTTLRTYYDYYLPTVNVEGEEDLYLSYYYGYCPRTGITTSDTLLIHISTDNGVTWTEILRNDSKELNTTSKQSTSGEYYPQTSSEWKFNSLSLADYAESSSLLVRFRVINGNNNTLALDQITLSAEEITVGLPEITESLASFIAYANNNHIYISFQPKENLDASLMVYDVMGNEVYNKNLGQLSSSLSYEESINASNFSKGIYFVVINTNGNRATQKIMLR